MASPTHATGVRSCEFQGFPAILVDTPHSRCYISTFGAHVLSFAPKGGRELLWMSPTSKRPPNSIRGGIPLCWPHFAKQGQDPSAQQHGIARTHQWRFSLAQTRPNGDTELAFVSSPTLHPISVMMTIRVGATLSQTLTSVNMTEKPFQLTQAFHTYFRVADARKIHISGLDGTKYLSKFHDFEQFSQHGDVKLEERFHLRSDRIYERTAGEYVLHDPIMRRKIKLSSQGSRTLVVWNPGEEVVKEFDDIPHDAWLQYFCLEVANAGEEVIELLPGHTAAISQTISVEDL